MIELEDIFSSLDDPEISRQIDAVVQKVQPNEHTKKFTFTVDADEDQRAFIKSHAETIRLLAPAGSGKTQSIVNRILFKASQGQRLDNFLVLTFDNSASLSLREKLQQGLQEHNVQHPDRPEILTLNKFGDQIIRGLLKDRIGRLDLGADPDTDQLESVRRALDSLKSQYPSKFALLPVKLSRRVYLDLISTLKNKIILPEDLIRRDREAISQVLHLAATTNIFEPWLALHRGTPDFKSITSNVLNALVYVFRRYDDINREHGRIDYDDQKLIPYLHLRQDAGLTKVATGRYIEVIVDEFQDINKLDFELIRLLSYGKRLTVVGDDDQSIYAFRGCSPDYIINFEQHINRQVETRILTRNYRCPSNVVEMGNRLIRHNEYRVKKTQNAHRTDLADIKLWHCVNSASEAQVIARFIKKLYLEKEPKGFRYSDIAILTRINSQSLPLQIALILEDIPYHCRVDENIIVSTTMRKLLGLIKLHLKLQADPRHTAIDDSRLILESLFPYTNSPRIKEFHELADNHGGYLGLADMSDRVLRTKGLDKVDYRKAIKGLAGTMTPFELVQHVSSSFKNLGGMVGSLEDAINGRLPLGEFVDIASRFKGNVAQFHFKMAELLEKVENGLYHKLEGDAVNILTYFRAKGRQWDTVIIPGANQRVIPLGNENIESERRLFYVAITRAASNLIVSFVRNAVGSRVDRSQFITESGLSTAEEKRASLIAADITPAVETISPDPEAKWRERGLTPVQQLLQDSQSILKEEQTEHKRTPVQKIIENGE